jgi:hypothetical protein
VAARQDLCVEIPQHLCELVEVPFGWASEKRLANLLSATASSRFALTPRARSWATCA